MRTEQEAERSSYLKEWGFDTPTFEAKARKSLETARGDLSEMTGALRQIVARMREIVLDLQKNRQPIAAELRKGFETAWDDLEQAFARARQRVRDAQKVSAGGEDLSDDWLG